MTKELREKDRQSQTGRDKSTSKNGAGGKFTWGAAGTENVPFKENPKDPNAEE